MKKILSVLLSLGMLFAFISCDQNPTEEPEIPVKSNSDSTDY